jgi:hypothetical protein
MLTLPEFIDAARTLHPTVPVAVVGEPTGLPLEVGDVESYSKPVFAHNIRQMCGYHTLSSGGFQRAPRDRNFVEIPEDNQLHTYKRAMQPNWRAGARTQIPTASGVTL